MEQTADVSQRFFRIVLSLYFGGVLVAILFLLYISAK
jgi:hypothetical protein